MRMILAGMDKRVILAGLIVVLLAAGNLAWNSPHARAESLNPQAATATPAASVTRTLLPTQPPVTEPPVTESPADMQMATPTPTPLPAEWLDNYQQTTGIILVAGMLILIVAAGVFNQLISDRQSKA